MSNWKYVCAACALAAMIGVAGCSSDDDPAVVPTLNEAYVGAIVDEFVGPMVDAVTQMGFLLLNNVPQPKAPGCTPITGVCDTGTLEYCPDVSSADLVFDQCHVDDWTFDGTITVTPAGVGVYYATFDLDMNGVPLVGAVTIDITQPPCVYEVFDNLTMSDSGITASMVGSLSVCETSDYPTGQITLWVTDPNLGLMRILMNANGGAIISMMIYDSFDEYQGACDYDIDTEAISCVFD